MTSPKNGKAAVVNTKQKAASVPIASASIQALFTKRHIAESVLLCGVVAAVVVVALKFTKKGSGQTTTTVPVTTGSVAASSSTVAPTTAAVTTTTTAAPTTTTTTTTTSSSAPTASISTQNVASSSVSTQLVTSSTTEVSKFHLGMAVPLLLIALVGCFLIWYMRPKQGHEGGVQMFQTGIVLSYVIGISLVILASLQLFFSIKNEPLATSLIFLATFLFTGVVAVLQHKFSLRFIRSMAVIIGLLVVGCVLSIELKMLPGVLSVAFIAAILVFFTRLALEDPMTRSSGIAFDLLMITTFMNALLVGQALRDSSTDSSMRAKIRGVSLGGIAGCVLMVILFGLVEFDGWNPKRIWSTLRGRRSATPAIKEEQPSEEEEETGGSPDEFNEHDLDLYPFPTDGNEGTGGASGASAKRKSFGGNHSSSPVEEDDVLKNDEGFQSIRHLLDERPRSSEQPKLKAPPSGMQNSQQQTRKIPNPLRRKQRKKAGNKLRNLKAPADDTNTTKYGNSNDPGGDDGVSGLLSGFKGLTLGDSNKGNTGAKLRKRK